LGERRFVLWTGLKGAIPILLGAFIVTGGVADSARLYEIVFVVVAFSVIVQGGLVPILASRLRVPLRTVEPEPWSLGVRFRHEPDTVRRYRVAHGSPADGAAISDLPLDEGTWVSLILRRGRLIPVRPETRLHPDDELITLTDREAEDRVNGLFQTASDHDGTQDSGVADGA
jgi:potassium/hydrogen antiporter